jgi:7-keto-8-aminopelargonate synthetase-like enzyme
MGDRAALADVEARLRAILEPYRDRLEEGQIYGVTTLRRRGAKAHDWFAGVQAANGYVKFNFLPMHGHPALLDGISPDLRRRKTGASVFRFTEVDDALLAELEALVARGFDAYAGGSAPRSRRSPRRETPVARRPSAPG